MKKKCYVYYDKNTGRVNSIIKKRKPGRSPHIECDISEVIGFLDNSWNKNEYVVAYKKNEDKTVIMKKENVVRLRQKSQKLYKIPRRNGESEINLLYYPDNILEIFLDMERISPLYMTDFKSDVEFEKGTEFRLFVVNKKTGDKIKDIIIEAQELLEAGVLFFRLPEECHPNNIAFYTYKLLNSYSWSIGKHKSKSPMKENIKYNIYKCDIRRKDGFEYDLVFSSNDNCLNVQNFIEDFPLARISGDLEFFITDYYDPHILHEKFIITEGTLGKKNFKIELSKDFDMEGKVILYNHKYISVLLEEQ